MVPGSLAAAPRRDGAAGRAGSRRADGAQPKPSGGLVLERVRVGRVHSCNWGRRDTAASAQGPAACGARRRARRTRAPGRRAAAPRRGVRGLAACQRPARGAQRHRGDPLGACRGELRPAAAGTRRRRPRRRAPRPHPLHHPRPRRRPAGRCSLPLQWLRRRSSALAPWARPWPATWRPRCSSAAKARCAAARRARALRPRPTLPGPGPARTRPPAF
jgi:hypothetical protein